MKIVFLDFDGVVSTPRAHMARTDAPLPDRWIDPIAVKLFNLLCEATDAAVVISSSWRLLYDGRESFREMMLRNGFAAALHADWRTERIDGPRGDEVAEWLSRHPEVTAHAILDDESDFRDGQPLVKTSMEFGLGQDDVFKAARFLGMASIELIRFLNGKREDAGPPVPKMPSRNQEILPVVP